MSAVEEEVVKELYPEFQQHRMQLAETQRIIYQAVVDPKVKREDLQKPDFWKHVARSFQPYTRLEVVTDDGQYFCELLVLNAGHNWAAVKELRYIELDGKSDIIKQSSAMDEYEIAWKGPVHKHVVLRKKDGEIVKAQMSTRKEADTFLSEYVKVITK